RVGRKGNTECPGLDTGHAGGASARTRRRQRLYLAAIGGRMSDVVRYRVLVMTFTVFGVLYRVLCLPVGPWVLGALGLLMMPHYWHAVLVLPVTLGSYELISWLLIGRWVRHAE